MECMIFHLYGVPKIAKLIEAENIIGVSVGWGWGNGQFFIGYHSVILNE